MRIIIIALALLLPACSAEITTGAQQQQQQYKTVCIDGVEYFKQGTRIDSVVYTTSGSVKLCPVQDNE